MTISQIADALVFDKTCECSPEQYDVYLSGEQVAYVRIRWGAMTVTCPDARGELVYDATIGEPLQGMFYDDDAREHYMARAREDIARWLAARKREVFP